ncbi:MAG: amino acid adenylation domain-containing protein [Jatrophihabitantaceae bacterium]
MTPTETGQNGLPSFDNLLAGFEATVRRFPDRTAVSFGDRRLSYAELDQLAAALAAEIAPTGRPVALLLPRSVDMIAAALAVLKAGSSYVPIDPGTPPARIELMLQDAEPELVISSRELAANLPAGSRVLHVDDPRTPGASTSPPAVRSSECAYVIFTSGTTGRPKGVQVSHRNVLNLFQATDRHFGFGPDDVWSLFHSFAFDFSVWEMWGALLYGGQVVVVAEDVSKDPVAFRRLLREENVTVLSQTPTAFGQLMHAELEHHDRLPLRWVVFGGEALHFPDLEPWVEKYGDETPELINMYGITEITVHASYRRVRKADLTQTASLIGQALPGSDLLLLDPDLAEVPEGQIGEIVVTGPGVALGYLRQPELTQQRFVTAPGGGRAYRSGDLARRRSDGELEYAGRADDQVKLRGFRVELGEVEAALVRQPGIRAAAAALRQLPTGEQALVGYLVAAGDFDEHRLRQDLFNVLPHYMVPTVLTAIKALPVTANGKLDRAALPDPAPTDSPVSRAARSLREELMCELFAQALGRSAVGIDDDFFALGGHSLSAIRLVNRIRAVLGLEVSLHELFARRTVAALAAHESTGSTRAPLTPRDRPAGIPLSHAQQRLWFLHQIHGASSAYNIPYALHLSGQLDVGALEAAIGDVAARHEVLRTIYPERDGLPFQQILPPEEARPVLARVSAGRDDLDELLRVAARNTFNLATDLPLRVTLFTVDAGENVLFLLLHHIAADGWSLEPLLEDLAQAYTARLAGTAPAWAPLSVQYADYAIWQRELLGEPDDPDSVSGRQLAFWSQYLDGAPAELDLPTDRPRPHTTEFRGDLVSLTIEADPHARLAELARSSGSTLTMVLQAAVLGLLTRLGAGEDIPLGLPIAGRTDESTHALVGYFVNTLVTRTDTSGDPSFAELVRRVRIANLAAYEHQDLPFERLVEMLNPERSAARHPLAQVLVDTQPAVAVGFTLPGLTVRAQPVSDHPAKLDLSFSFEEQHGPDGSAHGIQGAVTYSTDLFDRGSVELIAERLLRLLGAVLDQPGAPLSGIDILGDPERRLLEEFNDTDADMPDCPTVAALFERQADRTPEALALVQGQTRWTYRELDERANQVAHLLRDLGAGPESMVGLCLARGPEFVAAVLGVWKSGAAYTPLEPGHPAERRAYMLADSGASILLTQAELASDLSVSDTVERVLVDSDPRLSTAAATRLALTTSGRDLAYAVYTSGSTGKPKCVLLEHRGVVSRLRDVVERFDLTAADINLQVISLGFEVPVREIFGPLSIGGAVALLPPQGERDPGIVMQTIRESRPTVVICAVHSLLEALLAYDVDPADFDSVRLVGTGGETLHPREAEEMMNRWGCEVVNQYGPTETTMMACVHTVGEQDLAGRIPVGRPLPNTRIHVLDARLGAAPIGVPGEVYLAGTGVGRGYLGQPGLTASRFVANPYGKPGERMYRSGDLARWRADGNLEFVGRVDDQVKVRGFRIELGEIQTVLAEHPQVSVAAVIVREDRPGDRRLAAYVVPAGTAPAPADLRDHLASQLPEHMIPTTFTTLDALPLRLNGKLNRDLLPAPDASSLISGRAPRSPQEDILCQLFAEVLGLDEVGIDDDFFGLGGHSLLAARLISRVRTTLGVEMAMRSLFEAPTVAGLAQRLGSDSSADALEVMLPLRSRGTREAVWCIHPGGGLSWSYVGLLKQIPTEFPVYGVQSHGLLHPDEMPATVEEMAADYLERIQARQPKGPYHLLGWSLGGMVAFEMAVQLQAQGAEIGLLALLDCYPGMPDHFRVDDKTMLRSLLDPTRPEVIPEEGSIEMGRALEIMRQDTGALASLTEPQIVALLRTMSHNRQLARRYEPTPYDGDLLFFLATQERVEGAPTAEVWNEHITGRVVWHPIEAVHITMGDPEPLAEIGRIVAEVLTTL